MVSSTRRLVATRRLRLALATALVVCLGVPVAAGAATTHYAAPGGSGSAPCVEPAAPCNIERAVEFANHASGDTILLAPGTYHPAASLKIFGSVIISGEPGQPAPLIEATGEYGLFIQDRSTVRDVRIKSPSGTAAGLFLLAAGSTVERVESTGEASPGLRSDRRHGAQFPLRRRTGLRRWRRGRNVDLRIDALGDRNPSHQRHRDRGLRRDRPLAPTKALRSPWTRPTRSPPAVSSTCSPARTRRPPRSSSTSPTRIWKVSKPK